MSSRTDGLVGAHVAPERPLEAAEQVGADCVQIFLSNPQGWQKPDPRDDAQELRDSAVPVYVHAPYLINVCSPRNNVRYGSRKILQQTCEAAADVGAAAVIVHAGHAEDGVEEGFGRWVRSLEMLKSEVTVLIENTAGGDNAVARRFDALARALGGGRRGRHVVRARLLLRHLPRPRRRRGAVGRRRARARDRRARSTCCTSTTRATRPAPAPTGTPTSARARSAKSPCGR